MAVKTNVNKSNFIKVRDKKEKEENKINPISRISNSLYFN